MAITIGTLHLPTDKIQEEALKCLPASTYPLYQQERLSLYNAEWENPCCNDLFWLNAFMRVF